MAGAVISPLARLGADATLARHARGALSFYRSQLEQGGFPIPGGLDDLVAFLDEVVRLTGQLRPLVDGGSDDGGCHGHLLPISDAAAVANVSVRTLRRRIATGELDEVRVTEEQFIDAAELVRYLRARAGREEASA